MTDALTFDEGAECENAAAELGEGDECEHPPNRLYAWKAYDGSFCVGCCDCGAVLAGAAR